MSNQIGAVHDDNSKKFNFKQIPNKRDLPKYTDKLLALIVNEPSKLDEVVDFLEHIIYLIKNPDLKIELTKKLNKEYIESLDFKRYRKLDLLDFAKFVNSLKPFSTNYDINYIFFKKSYEIQGYNIFKYASEKHDLDKDKFKKILTETGDSFNTRKNFSVALFDLFVSRNEMPLYTALLEQALTEGNNEVVNYFCLSKPILADTSHSKFCKDFLTSINFLTLTAFAAFKGFRISFEKQKGEPDIYDCYKAIEVRTEGEDLEKLLKSLYKEYKPFYDKALIYCMYNKKDLLDSISYLPGAQETIDKFLKKPKATLPIAIPAANNTSPSSSPSTTGLYFPQNQNLNEELSTGAEVVYGQR